MLDLLKKDFQPSILNIFKALKETIPKELRKSMRTVSHQIKNINKEIEIILKNKPNRNSEAEEFNTK